MINYIRLKFCQTTSKPGKLEPEACRPMTTTKVNSLPNEILEYAFGFAHPEVDVFHHEYFGGSSTWSLSHVSRSWRSVVLGSKPLWSRLLLQNIPSDALHIAPTVIPRLCLAIVRSAPIPFSVRVTDFGGDSESESYDSDSDPPSPRTHRYRLQRGLIYGPIFANGYRLDTFWEEARFIESAYDMFSLFPIPFPRLRALRLNGEAIFVGIGEDTPIPRIAPVLRELHLSRFKLTQDHQQIVFSSLCLPWSQITRLTADRCDFEDMTSGQLFHIHMFLNNFPNLQILTWLFDEDEEQEWYTEDLELAGDDIKTLNIRGKIAVLMPLLDHTHVPNLQKLQLDLLDGPCAQDWQSEDSEYTTSEASQRAWSPHFWEPGFLKTISDFINRLHDKESMTSLALHGFFDLPVLNWIQQLPNLRALSVHLMDGALVNHLTWSGLNRTLPFLEMLTWSFDSAATKVEDQRIVKMAKSRTNPPAGSVAVRVIHIRLLYEPQDGETIKKSFLVKRLKAVARIHLEVLDLQDIEWHPLRLYT